MWHTQDIADYKGILEDLSSEESMDNAAGNTSGTGVPADKVTESRLEWSTFHRRSPRCEYTFDYFEKVCTAPLSTRV